MADSSAVNEYAAGGANTISVLPSRHHIWSCGAMTRGNAHVYVA
jgi:hypothetical protein